MQNIQMGFITMLEDPDEALMKLWHSTERGKPGSSLPA